MSSLGGYALTGDSWFWNNASGGLDSVEKQYVLLSGTATQARVWFETAAAAGQQLKFKVWRQNGANLDVIAATSAIDVSGLGVGEHVIDLPQSLTCLAGDFIGIWMGNTVGLFKIEAVATGGVGRYKAGDNAGSNAESGFTSGAYINCVEFLGTLAPLAVTGITPSSGVNNGTVSITNLAGTNFQTGATVKLTKAGQSDVNATNVVRVSSVKITCDLPITGAVTGAWTVRVTNPDTQYAELTDGFTVSTSTAPGISSITPSTGVNNGTVSITNLAGTNFQTGATVKLTKAGQSDINAINVVRVSSTQITCDLPLTGAATGTWTVRVTNPDTEYGELVNGFTVTAPQGTGRILVEGDSIARGYTSGAPPYEGFRYPLQDFLGNGVFDFVGPYSDGAAGHDDDHGAVNGQTTATLNTNLDSHLDTYLPMTNPGHSTVILYTGINDIAQGVSAATARDRLEQAIDLVYAHDPSLFILVCQIAPADGVAYLQTLIDYNALIPTLVNAKRGSGYRIAVADLYTVYTMHLGWETDYMGPDGVHPIARGYEVMGEAIGVALNMLFAEIDAPIDAGGSGSWDDLTSEMTIDGSIGKLIVDKLNMIDVAISSRAAAAVCTEARLAELDPANLPADIDNLIAGAGGITLAEIEASTVLAKESTSAAILAECQTHPTLAQIEADGALSRVYLPVFQANVATTIVQTKEVAIMRGDSPRITFDLGADWTGWTPKFGVKADPKDSTYVIAIKDAVWTNAALGQGYVDLLATETTTAGILVAEIELQNGLQRQTAVRFTLKILEDVIK